ncbi:MAG: EAL domain-containing protein, partial [Gammaproteobacteria bacterium]
MIEDLELLLESEVALNVPLAPQPRGARGAGFQVTAGELERALAADELFLVYQPKVECRTRALDGFEALVRWRHPEHGLVMPDRFIPQAEESGLIDALTARVLELGLAWLAAWDTAADIDTDSLRAARMLSLSVNLSPRSLTSASLLADLEARCAHHGIAPARLILELTETATMADPVTSLDLLTRLRARGFRLAIDDFGTGFSSMVQLVRLPFSEIKVDKSFVMTAGASLESRKVIRSVVDLGRSLKLTTTAEGVEDEDVLALLRELGCDLAQGYLESRPLDAAAAGAWARQRFR